ncbi:MAG: hypothetical protein WB784_05680 [Rhodanobacteraceae bacterium]
MTIAPITLNGEALQLADRTGVDRATAQCGAVTLIQRFGGALSDSVIAPADNGNGANAFKDFNEYYVWILDNRSRALQGLGRWDDAVTQLRKASRRPENGAINVSQALNLGALYADLDRPDEALAAVSDLGTVSPYGRMQLEQVRLMASIKREDELAVDTHLAFMREHRADAIGTYQRALLAANRMDAAATFLIELLRSEVWRGRALTAMQEYAGVPMAPSTMVTNARWHAVIARPGVQSELTKVGRIEQINLAPPSD